MKYAIHQFHSVDHEQKINSENKPPIVDHGRSRVLNFTGSDLVPQGGYRLGCRQGGQDVAAYSK